MTKEAEKLLEYINKRAKNKNSKELSFNILDITHNIEFHKKIDDLCEELKKSKVIYEYRICENKLIVTLNAEKEEYIEKNEIQINVCIGGTMNFCCANYHLVSDDN